MINQLESLRPARSFSGSSMSHHRVVIPVGQAVALDLTPDRGAMTPQAPPDLSSAEPNITQPHNLDAFLAADPATWTSRP